MVCEVAVIVGDDFGSYLGGRAVTTYLIEVERQGALVSLVEVGSDTTSYVQTPLSPQTSYM